MQDRDGSAPEPETPKVRRRRRHSTAWKTTPKGVKIAILACLLALTVVLAVNYQHRIERVQQAAPPPAPNLGESFDKIVSKSPKFELVVSNSALNPATHRIEGVVTNTSDRSYADIRISFYLPSPDLMAAGQTDVKLPDLGPHESARFATRPLAHTFSQWTVKEIIGTSR